MALSPELKQEITDLVNGERVVLFMKGTRSAPQCGFSASVVEILDDLLDGYATVDVLARPDLRDGIKEFSDWPTIPQLYVGGEFLGGADIVREMFASGELAKVLGVQAPGLEGPLPSIRITDEAARQIEQAAAADPEGPHLHLEISPRFEHALFFQKPGPRYVEVKAGPMSLWLDAKSAARADGLVIDYVDGPEGSGFKIDNPNKGRPDGESQAKASANGAPPPLPPVAPPSLTVTDPARAQFVAALEQEQESGDGERYGVRVSARRMGATKVDYELGIITEAEKKDADLVVEQGGVTFYMDPLSAKNLDGAVIDFVDNGDQGSGFKFENPRLSQGWKDPLADRFQRFLDDEINPSIAAHGGYVQLLDLVGDTAYVLMGGGCQGCSSAAATLYDGIAERVKQAVPEVKHLIDTTDHAAGSNPYYRA